jgi:hypothetical protein
LASIWSTGKKIFRGRAYRAFIKNFIQNKLQEFKLLIELRSSEIIIPAIRAVTELVELYLHYPKLCKNLIKVFFHLKKLTAIIRFSQLYAYGVNNIPVLRKLVVLPLWYSAKWLELALSFSQSFSRFLDELNMVIL